MQDCRGACLNEPSVVANECNCVRYLAAETAALQVVSLGLDSSHRSNIFARLFLREFESRLKLQRRDVCFRPAAQSGGKSFYFAPDHYKKLLVSQLLGNDLFSGFFCLR